MSWRWWTSLSPLDTNINNSLLYKTMIILTRWAFFLFLTLKYKSFNLISVSHARDRHSCKERIFLTRIQCFEVLRMFKQKGQTKQVIIAVHLNIKRVLNLSEFYLFCTLSSIYVNSINKISNISSVAPT